MKYKYSTVFPPSYTKKFIRRPMVEIEIFGPKSKLKQLALIDSGADYSLFNFDIAELVGIDLKNAKQDKVTGITGHGEIFFTDIEIKIEHLDNKIRIPAGFIKSPHVSVLLGQEAFFDLNRIKFERDHDAFEINPVGK